jgi:nucleotide-binding universal stress UspA family protein
MYNKLLVPLDGSELAECTLGHVRAIVTGCNIPEVVLLRVVEPLPGQTVAALAEAGGNLLNELEASQKEEASDYIQKMAAMLQKEGINAKPVLVSGYAAEEILNYSKNNKVDLIIMSTHGRSGIKRWIMGSVANRVLGHSSIPVLTIIPAGCRI